MRSSIRYNSRCGLIIISIGPCLINIIKDPRSTVIVLRLKLSPKQHTYTKRYAYNIHIQTHGLSKSTHHPPRHIDIITHRYIPPRHLPSRRRRPGQRRRPGHRQVSWVTRTPPGPPAPVLSAARPARPGQGSVTLSPAVAITVFIRVSPRPAGRHERRISQPATPNTITDDCRYTHRHTDRRAASGGRAGASPPSFVWGDGFLGTKTHLP